jgi:hypothetical protein
VTTPTSANVTDTSATLGGNVASDGGATITERGVVYAPTATNSDPQIGGTGVTKVATSGTTGIFTVDVTGLSPGTGYSFKAYATNSVGTSYTSAATFTTQAPSDTTPPTVASIDDGDADDAVVTRATLTYTVTFSEDIDAMTVSASDFDNAGTSSITIGTITEASAGVFTVQVTPTSAGTLQLRIPSAADIRDVAGNALATPVTDDTTLTVTTGPFVVTKTADTNDGTCDSDCSPARSDRAREQPGRCGHNHLQHPRRDRRRLQLGDRRLHDRSNFSAAHRYPAGHDRRLHAAGRFG